MSRRSSQATVVDTSVSAPRSRKTLSFHCSPPVRKSAAFEENLVIPLSPIRHLNFVLRRKPIGAPRLDSISLSTHPATDDLAVGAVAIRVAFVEVVRANSGIAGNISIDALNAQIEIRQFRQLWKVESRVPCRNSRIRDWIGLIVGHAVRI